MKSVTISLALVLILGGLTGCSSEKKSVDETNSKNITEENDDNIEKKETNENNGQATFYDAEGNIVDISIN